MISTEYAVSMLTNSELYLPKTELPTHLQLLYDEIARIRESLPKSYDKVAQILAFARPLIEIVLANCGVADPPRSKGMKGPIPTPKVTFMLMQILSEVGWIGGSRQVEREINAHPTWLKALELKKSPHHSVLGKFRIAMGEEFFHRFFIELTRIMLQLGYIDQGEGAAGIIDSAPRDANMNFARANVNVTLDEALIENFFQTIDVCRFTTSIPTSTRGKKPTFTYEILSRFLLFEQLGGFLSRSKALRHLKEYSHLATLIGIPSGAELSDATVSNFEKRCGGKNVVFKALIDQISDFFGIHPLSDDGKVVPFFSVRHI